MELYTNQLKALVTVAPKNDTRQYLNGVLCDPAGYAVATDGGIMLAVRTEPFDGGAFIIPRAACELAIKAAGKCPRLSVEDHEFEPVGIRFAPVDGHFVDWCRAIPLCKATGEAAQFNPDLLMQLQTAARHLHGKKRAISISHNGGGPALVDVGPNALGIIMPWRAEPLTAEYVSEFLKPAERVRS